MRTHCGCLLDALHSQYLRILDRLCNCGGERTVAAGRMRYIVNIFASSIHVLRVLRLTFSERIAHCRYVCFALPFQKGWHTVRVLE